LTATAPTSRERISATVSCDFNRRAMSAEVRWVKKRNGNRSRCRRNRALPNVDISVCTRSRLPCCNQVNATVVSMTTAIDRNSGGSTDRSLPKSTESTKMRVNAGVVTPSATSSRLAARIRASDRRIPLSREPTSPSGRCRRPPGVKPVPGLKVSTTPVKLPSKSSGVTARRPLPGSLRYTTRRPNRRPLPSHTTKWLNFQNRIAGGRTSASADTSACMPLASSPYWRAARRTLIALDPSRATPQAMRNSSSGTYRP